MKLPIWVHQVQTSYMQSELGPSDVGLPFNTVYGKAADGLNFMSTWDKHAAAVDGLAAVIRRERNHQVEDGRGYIPWMVPRGMQPGVEEIDYIEAEATLAAQIAEAGAGPGERGVVILDLEPYYHGGAAPQFWRSDLMGADPEFFVKQWVTEFHAHSPNAEIWLAVDAREPHLQMVNFNVWLDAIQDRGMKTMILPMVYWTDFRVKPKVAIDNTLALLSDVYAIPPHKISMIFPGNAVPRGPEGLVDAIQYAAEVGTDRPSIWQRVNLSRENAEAIEEMVDPWFGEVTEEPLVSDYEREEGAPVVFELEPLLRLAYIRGFSAGRDKLLQFTRLRLDQLEDDLSARESDIEEAVADLYP